MLPIVAVVGRPNVGKSTLVNRIVGGRPAVTEEMPGVTRDRREFRAEWIGREFLLVDTGGWELKPGEPIVSEIRQQAEAALATADVIVYVTDATAGVSDDDSGVIRMLRSADAPIVFAANKIDDGGKERLIDDLWALGIGEPIPVSAFHGRGMGDLLDRIVELLPESEEEPPDDDLPRLAIIGRPNVGKSTLLNHLLGENRVIVSEVPGTTRDPIDTVVELDGDQRIAAEVVEAGASLVIILNKWDVIDEEARDIMERSLGDRFGFVSWAPVIRISALTGARTKRIPGAIRYVLETRQNRIGTGELNRLVREWTGAHPPPVRKGRRPRILYAVQGGVGPPTFIMFVGGGELGPDYLRFLEGRLRNEVDFTGAPVRVIARRRERPPT
jgi:GTP-binding protein